jgi:hypothetical protein
LVRTLYFALKETGNGEQATEKCPNNCGNCYNTNIKNYRTCLEKIKQIGNPPQFWKDFLNRSENQWQNQIQIYSDYLAPGQELFDKMIDTIRGIVEIEQAERDRSLEKTIQIIGVGLGAGAIVSGVVTQHIDKAAPLSFNNRLHPIVSSLFWSVVATLFFGALAWLWTKRK